MDDVDSRINDLIHALWQAIIKSINQVVESDGSFGFARFEALANPSIDQILNAVQVAEPVVSVVLNSPQIQANPEWVMQLLNCQQAIHLIRRTHVSLKNGDEAEYQDCLKKLRTQKQ